METIGAQLQNSSRWSSDANTCQRPSSDANLTLLSPASSNMGTFRLLVHAAYLVGRVLQLVSDHKSGDQLTGARRAQLYRTICALATLLEVELQTSLVSVNVARSVINR